MTSEPELKKARGAKARRITHVLAFDVEATGPDVLSHRVPELGACVFRIGKWQEPVATWYRAIGDPKGEGTPLSWDLTTLQEYWHACNDDAPVVDGKKQSRLQMLNVRKKEHGVVEEEQAMREFIAFAREQNGKLADNEMMVVVTDTAAFDTVWMNVMLSRAAMSDASTDRVMSLNYLFGKYRPVRDLTSFYFGVGRKFELWGSEKAATEALAVADLPEEVKRFKHDHNPLNDALSIGATAAYLLNIIEKQ